MMGTSWFCRPLPPPGAWGQSGAGPDSTSGGGDGASGEKALESQDRGGGEEKPEGSSTPGGDTGARKGKGCSRWARPQREEDPGPGWGPRPPPAGSHSPGQLASDGQGVAPLQGPVFLPLRARNGPDWLLRGDAVPGGVGRTRSPGPPTLLITLPREETRPGGSETCCLLFPLPLTAGPCRLPPPRACAGLGPSHLPCTPQSALPPPEVQLLCQPPSKAGLSLSLT